VSNPAEREEVIHVRKALTVTVVFLTAFLFMAVPANAAGSSDHGALHFDLSITLTAEQGYWWGGLTGPFSGMVTYKGDPDHTAWGSYYVGHFYEVFTICVGEPVTPTGCPEPEGSYITGVDQGVYLYQNGSGKWHFIAQGWVTGASADYAYLIGYEYRENGWTTNPWEFPNVALYGVGTAHMTPAQT